MTAFNALVRRRRLMIWIKNSWARFASRGCIILMLWGAYKCLDVFDWRALPKFAAFVFLAALLIWLNRRVAFPSGTLGRGVWAESIFCAVLVAAVSVFSMFHYWPFLFVPPEADMGFLTQRAAVAFLRDGDFLYGARRITPWFSDPYRGYLSGPFMVVGYAASAFYQMSGFKLQNLTYLIGTGILTAAIAFYLRGGQDITDRVATALFAALLYVIPFRTWFEPLVRGTNDGFPVFLVMLSIYYMTKNRWMAAGLFAGLSLSSKLSPAVFLVVALLRPSTDRRFFAGLGVGVLPLAAAFAWNPLGTYLHLIKFHSTKAFDSTSTVFSAACWNARLPKGHRPYRSRRGNLLQLEAPGQHYGGSPSVCTHYAFV